MKYTSEEAKLLLKNFFDEMYTWGLNAIARFNPASENSQEIQQELKKELKEIYDKYVTVKDRKTGRIESMTISLGEPDYNPNNERIQSIREKPNVFEIETKKSYLDDYFEIYQYKIKATANGLRIDSKERFSDFEKKWVKDIL